MYLAVICLAPHSSFHVFDIHSSPGATSPEPGGAGPVSEGGGGEEKRKHIKVCARCNYDDTRLTHMGVF